MIHFTLCIPTHQQITDLLERLRKTVAILSHGHLLQSSDWEYISDMLKPPKDVCTGTRGI
jgi:hypothetical protein